MTKAVSKSVCVIIAAKDAAQTISRAVASALDQPETAEVVVIDDGSSDDTAEVARGVDDGSGRLEIVRFKENRGPSAARNHAISISRSPVLAVLDADDFFLPGRLQQLLFEGSWDFIADNVAFIDDTHHGGHLDLAQFSPSPRMLDFAGFIEGNISRSGALRGEIGFLKPLMRRTFLADHGLCYNEALRLGEDYDLYARALAKGARYKIIHSCGYAALIRSNSLSGHHRTIDLKNLYEADRAILAGRLLSKADEAVLRRHERHIRDRYELRRFLDHKNDSGLNSALAYALRRPATLRPIISGIFADKTRRYRTLLSSQPVCSDSGKVRYLLDV